MLLRKWLVCWLSASLAWMGFAQQPVQVPQPPAGAPAKEKQEAGTLQVVVIEGQDARNDLRSGKAVAPVVEVRDEAGNPVAGAEVVFQLPWEGPSGTFHGWLRTQTVRTGSDGRATVEGYAPNDQAGSFEIRVTARQGLKVGTAVIKQTNVGKPGSSTRASRSGCRWWVVGLLVAGASAISAAVAAAASN